MGVGRNVRNETGKEEVIKKKTVYVDFHFSVITVGWY